LNPKTWINLKNDENVDLKKSLINVNQDLEKIDKDLYDNYKWKLEIDNINLLYVVLTRAKEELYIISEKNLDSKGNEKINYFSGIFIHYLKKINMWEDTKSTFEFGLKEVIKNKKSSSNNITQKLFEVNSRIKQNIIIKPKNINSWINDFSDAQDEGNIFHKIMEEINSEKDVPIALDKFYELGFIESDEKEDYERKIFAIINHPSLKKYYQDNLVYFNEREIISKKGNVVVPDRLVFLNKTDVVIIDYKTGKENGFHKTQMKKYQAMLEEMNLKVEENLLVYIDKKTIINTIK